MRKADRAQVMMITRDKGTLVSVKKVRTAELWHVIAGSNGMTAKKATEIAHNLLEAGIHNTYTDSYGYSVAFKPHFKVVELESNFIRRVDESVDELIEANTYEVKYDKDVYYQKYPHLIFITKLYLQGCTPDHIAKGWLEIMHNYPVPKTPRRKWE